MRRTRRHAGLALSAAAAGLLALTSTAAAEIQRVDDGQGRTIVFDIRASGVDVPGYAAIMRAALHGDEIGSVTIRVVPPQQIGPLCGSGAAACYRFAGGRGTITVPARAPSDVEHALLHEYGHHVDFSIDTPQATGRGGDGTPGWWGARGVAGLLAGGSVAYDYSLGWSRSIAEVYAEDYVQAHGPSRFGISWLSPPSGATLDALRADIVGAPAPPVRPDPVPPAPPPVADPPGPIGGEPRGAPPPATAGARARAGKVKRGRTRRVRGRAVTPYAGFVRAGGTVSIRLGAAAGRRVAVRASVRRASRADALLVGIVCGRRTLVARTARSRRAAGFARTLRGGPCRLVIRNPGGSTTRFRLVATVARR